MPLCPKLHIWSLQLIFMCAHLICNFYCQRNVKIWLTFESKGKMITIEDSMISVSLNTGLYSWPESSNAHTLMISDVTSLRSRWIRMGVRAPLCVQFQPSSDPWRLMPTLLICCTLLIVIDKGSTIGLTSSKYQQVELKEEEEEDQFLLATAAHRLSIKVIIFLIKGINT